MGLPENFPDEILGDEERNLTGVVPWSESDADSSRRRREHHVVNPTLSRISTGETSISPSKSLKRNALFGGKGIAICAALGSAVGITIGAAWPGAHSLTEKSYNLRGVLAPIFAVSKKAELPVQVAPAIANVTAPDFSEIQNKLNTIAHELSSVQQNVKELAAGQERLRKTQEQLAQTQSRFAVLQTEANLKQNMQRTTQPAPHPTEGRKLMRQEFFTWRDR